MSFEDAPSRPSGAAGRFARLVRLLCTRAMDLAVPPACAACHVPLQAHHTLCGACWSGIAFIRAPLCTVTGIPLPFATGETMVSARALADPPAYDHARAVAVHSGTMRKLVHQFKYADRHEARPLFGRWLAEAGRDLIADADVLVPVPMSRWRLILRHYNQAALLAGELSRLTRLTSEPLALRRTRHAHRQVGLTAAQRRRNVAGAFRVPHTQRRKIAGKRVLLVDDVADSGRTLALAVQMLMDAGAQVRSVCIYTKPGSIASPDYSWRETDRWIDFPWSARGTVVEEDAGVSPDEASA